MNILKNNGKYHFFNQLTIVDKLEPKNYLFNFDGNGNCYLEDIEDFKFPDKIYEFDGGLSSLVKISFENTKKNLGVLLTGTKGQGKSLKAKLLCREINLPTIIINKSIPSGVDFIEFLNDIKQDYCLYVDEFEKLFANTSSSEEKNFHSQESFLSFMDGVMTNSHRILFLLTTNERVNEFLINRPSRIKFLREYEELPEELFETIVEDLLVNKEFKEDLEDNVSLINLNIDLLISIINDINLFNKPFSEFKENYNYKFEHYKYEMIVSENGVEKYTKFFTSERKIKNSWQHIGGFRVDQLTKFTKDEISFVSQYVDYDDDENEIVKTYTVKLLPMSNSHKSYAF